MKFRMDLAAMMLALLAALSACKREEGTMEKAGKAMDEAVHDGKKAVEDAAGDVGEAIKDAKDGG